MAVLGRLLVSSAERLDLPDLLSVDSYSGGDWKYFVRSLVGGDTPYVLKGFDVIDPQNAIGTQSCSIRVADSVVYYPGSNSGSFFHGLEDGNANALPLVPELRKNAVNYVYLTFSTFNTSIDTRAFWDPDKDGGVGGEFTQDVNTEAVLKVDVNVSTGSFPANTIPVAKITVGPVVITAIEDARDLMFRLGTGGINPDPFSRYNFRSLPSAPYKRSEPPTTMTSPSDPNPFQGADKNILTLKEWMDVVMTKLTELGGSVFWYEDAATYNLVANFQDALATSFKSKGQWIHDSSTPGLVTWTEDIVVKTTQDTRDTYIRAGSKVLADEQVMYVPLVRQQALNGSDQEVMFINGQNYLNTVGGSLGLFTNLRKGDWVKKITDPNHMYLQVQEFYDTINLGGSVTTAANARSVRLSSTYLGSTGVEKGRFDRGEYLASDVIVTDRDDTNLSLAGGNFHWMAIRSDTIENVASVQSYTLSGTLSEPDGQTAKVTVAAHGLVDGDIIAVSAPVAQAGAYTVEVEDANVFYIQTTNMTTGAFTATYAVATTAARSNGYGFQLESANHGFETGETVIIAGTTNYNGAWIIKKRDATNFQFAMNSAVATETTGTATLARVNVRAEQGIIKLVQGESADIGELETQNIKSFIGMQSIAETYPFYSIPGGYNALEGMQNYNSLATDSLTTRASRLSAMMADKAQDKAIKALASDIHFVTNTTNGAAQEITFLPAASTLTFAQPGSPNGNAVVTLPNSAPGISLTANQVAYILIDRNAATTPSILVSDIATAPIGENVFVVAMRLSGTDIYLWDGASWKVGTNPTHEFRANQDLNAKLIAGGTWTFSLANSLSWSTSAYIQIPGVQLNRNEIAAGNVTLTSGQCAYVSLNRDDGVGASLLVPTVVAINAVPSDVDAFIIAINDGTSVVVGDSMRLIGGESKLLYAGTSDQTLTFIGSPDAADSTPDYTTNYVVTDGTSLVTAISDLDQAAMDTATYIGSPDPNDTTPDYSSNNFILDGDSLTTAIGKLDNAMLSGQSDGFQDRNEKLVRGGTWGWDSSVAGGTLTWSADAFIQVPGLLESRNRIPTSSIVIPNDGDVLYVDINRSGATPATLTLTTAAIGSVTFHNDRLIIARRVGNDLLLGNGTILVQSGTYARLDGDEIPTIFGQLRLKSNLVSPKRVLITGVDQTLLEGTTLGVELKKLLLSFTGAQIDFVTGTVYASDGITPLGINFTPATITASQYHWYSVSLVPSTITANNKIGAQVLVISATGDGATADLAPRAAFGGTIKLGQVVVQQSGADIANIVQSNIVQLGVGSGSGSSSTSGTGGAAMSPADGFRALVYDTFDVFPNDSTSKVNNTLTKASYSVVNEMYTMLCDKSKTFTTSGTNYTISAPPTYTVQAGDIIYHNASGQFRRVATVSTTTTGTLDAAFTPDLSGAAGMVSQAVWSVDLVNYGDATQKTRLRDFFPSTNINVINIAYLDSLTAGDGVADYVDPARVVVAATSQGLQTDVTQPTGAQFTAFFARPAAPNAVTNYSLQGFANNERLFLCFFPSPTNGSVTSTANVLEYSCSEYADSVVNNGGYLDSAYAMSDSTGTPNNCSNPTVSGGLSYLSLNFTYNMSINPGKVNGDLCVKVDGQEIPRFYSGVVGAYYEEMTPGQIRFWADLSGSSLSLHVQRRQGSIDTTTSNTSRLATIYDAVVGTSAQVSAGVATHSTFASAISTVSGMGGGRILALTGTYVENVNLNSNDISIEGKGRSTVISGTLTMSATGGLIRAMKVGGNITLSGNLNHLNDTWLANSFTLSDTGTDNLYSVISE